MYKYTQTLAGGGGRGRGRLFELILDSKPVLRVSCFITIALEWGAHDLLFPVFS